jgi:hypothetical protein
MTGAVARCVPQELPAGHRNRHSGGQTSRLLLLGLVRTRHVDPTEIAHLDPELRSFFNVNTAEEWNRALAKLEFAFPDDAA